MYQKFKLKNLTKKQKLLIVATFTIVICLGIWLFVSKDKTNLEQAQITQPMVAEQVTETSEVVPETTPPVVETPKPTPPVVEPVSQWPVTYTTAEASSITVVVNKKHKLPSTYAPAVVSVSGGQMRSEAATAMSQMLTDAENSGVGMKIISSYRSYSTQVTTYQKWVNLQGQAEADRGSARPGHSEHQTGLAADLGNPDGSCNLLECFGSGAQGVWLADNAHNYGFIIRYPNGKESLTGYQYEPWHVRYVGVDVATAIYQSGLTMDQYYGVEAGDY